MIVSKTKHEKAWDLRQPGIEYGSWGGHTDHVNGRKVGRGARRRPALPVEQRLGIKGEAPGQGVDPAEDGGDEGQECDHIGAPTTV